MAGSVYVTMTLLLHLFARHAFCCVGNHLVDSDYRQMYCDAEVVFRGSPTMAKSSVAIDADGRQMEASTHTFKVQQWYYGDVPPTQTITVSRSWKEGDDPCDAASFPDPTGTSSFLVFASRAGSYFTVQDTCRHSFPWVCLPESFKSNLPIVC